MSSSCGTKRGTVELADAGDSGAQPPQRQRLSQVADDSGELAAALRAQLKEQHDMMEAQLTCPITQAPPEICFVFFVPE